MSGVWHNNEILGPVFIKKKFTQFWPWIDIHIDFIVKNYYSPML